MKLVVLGCAGSFPSAESAASAYLVHATDLSGRIWTVLLDLGNGAMGALERWGDPESVDLIALTHLHADHCSDLSVLSVRRRYRPAGPCPSVEVWGPVGTDHRIAQLSGEDRATDPTGHFEVRTWCEGSPVQVGPITVEPVSMNHTVEAYGFRITGPSENDPNRLMTLSYTGDTDSGPGLETLARDTDLLLAEAAFHEGRDDHLRGVHLTAKRAAEAADRGGSRLLVLTHLPSWNDPVRAAEEAREVYNGPLEFAAPGRVFSL